VVDAAGAPVANAWVVVDDVTWSSTDAGGRFHVAAMRAGAYRCVARAPDGSEGEAVLTVPGAGVDIVVRRRTSRAAAKQRR
jgi:hypothetical protein